MHCLQTPKQHAVSYKDNETGILNLTELRSSFYAPETTEKRFPKEIDDKFLKKFSVMKYQLQNVFVINNSNQLYQTLTEYQNGKIEAIPFHMLLDALGKIFKVD